MILLAEHDEPSLAAKKKQHATSSKKTTSPLKNRVWGFKKKASGRISSETRSTSKTATGSVQFSYETASGRGYYYTRDHLGSVRELVDGSGNLLTRYGYDVYGRTTTTYVSGSHDTVWQYAGMQAHPASGLYLPTFRGGYDPNLGIFIQRDSWEERGGLNLYEYAADNPMSFIDPLGFAPTMDVTPGKSGLDSQQVDVSIKGCTCKNVQFIQTVSRNGGPTGVDNPGNKPGDPYYHNLTAMSGGNPNAPTTMEDWPGSGWQSGDDHTFWPSYQFFSGVTYNFETCAVCLDGGTPKIIGCRKWSLHWDSLGGHPTNKGEGKDLTPEPPSPDFHKKSGL